MTVYESLYYNRKNKISLYVFAMMDFFNDMYLPIKKKYDVYERIKLYLYYYNR